jgi:CSLREA domain-containing protein
MWTKISVWAAVLAAAIAGSVAIGPDAARAHDAILVLTTEDEMLADGDCSLREAVRAANTNTSFDFCSTGSAVEPDMIVLLEGTYTLSVAGTGEDGNMTGDLDVMGDAIFIGPGPANASVQGNGIDRVLDVHTGNVQLIGFGIHGGAASEGAGVRNGDMLSTENVVISGNDSTGNGGGIASAGLLTVLTSTLSGNDASQGGAIANTGTAQIENSTLSGNSAGQGGALYNCGTATLTNDTISGNTVDGQGGGIYEGCFDTLSLTNVTIANNEASFGKAIGAGGLYVSSATGGSATVKNTIISGNTGVNCQGRDAITSQGHNLEEGPTFEEPTLCGFDAAGDVVEESTSLEALAPNNGVTQSHALQAGSPAVDGVGNGCPPPTGDQRSLLRPIDGDNDGEALCDIGSFESDPLGVGVTATPSSTVTVPTPETPGPTPAGPTPGPDGDPLAATATVGASGLPVTGGSDSGSSWRISLAVMALAAAVACGVALAAARARR